LSDWKQEAKRLYFDEHRTWGEIISRLQGNFPGLPADRIRDKIRQPIRDDPRYKAARQAAKSNPEPEYRESTGWKNGQYESDRLIEICEGQTITPEIVLRAHNLDPDEWEVVSYRNNRWHNQVRGGKRLVMYQSKLLAKPRTEGVTFADVERFFAGKPFGEDKPPIEPRQYNPDGETLEIDVADLHAGLRSWGRETGESCDLNITRERFRAAMADVLGRCQGRKFKRIILALLGDLLHIDNNQQTTTRGTFQQADGRTPKIFDVTLNMLIEAIDAFAGIAPVDVVYTAGNHDGTSGWMLIKALEMAYKRDPNVTVDVEPNPQKHKLVGDTLIGFVHGDMPPKNLSGWLQVRARQMATPIRWMEVHSGHEHTDRVRERIQTEDAEGVIVRTMPTISPASTWEHQQGYDGAVKTVVSFVWSDALGLREMWYSNM